MSNHLLAHSAFAPRLAVYPTSEVNDLIAHSVGLPDLSTLLAPFAESIEKVSLRNHNFENNTVASRFPLRFDEALRVQDVGPWETQGGWLDQVGTEIQQKAPHWIKDLSRPTGLIVTSAKHPEPLNAVADLYASTSAAALEADRPYMEPNVLRYYVVLHDVQSTSVSRSDSLALLDQIKKAYGIHCALLDIHSWNPDAPPPLEGQPDTRPSLFDSLWTPYLPQTNEQPPFVHMGEKDAYNIKVFLRELVVKSLIPWMERSVQSWNETLAASRRGITGRLFNVGRRFLGSGTGSAKDTTNNPYAFNQVKRWYPHQATEAQTRKLADFAFALRDYQLAVSMYELARKEFQTDRAWLDYAHATRMLGLAQLLQTSIRPGYSNKAIDPDVLLEQAYNTTLALSGPSAALAQLDDIKAICLFIDAYKHLGRLRTAPQMLVRSAGDVEEVSAALLLEQAAVTDLAFRPLAFRRKAGFHYCMAAIRYEKIGLKPLAQHCLTQASHIYMQDLASVPKDQDKPFDSSEYAQLSWPLIESYIHQALGRQAYNLGQSEQALEHFLALLAHAAREDSDEGGQGAWADLKQAYDSLGSRAEDVLADRQSFFKQPIFDVKVSRISFESQESINSMQDSIAAKPDVEALETLMLSTGFQDDPKSAPTAFNQGRSGNIAGVSEPFHVVLTARNPMSAWLVLTDLQLVVSEEHKALMIESIPKIDVEPLGSAEVKFAITCSKEMTFNTQAITFTANGVLKCRQSLERKGKRLQATREQRLEPTYAKDLSLQVTVKPPVPKLQVDTAALPDNLLAGQTCISHIIVKNCTSESVADLRILSSHPHFLLPLQEESDPYASTDLQQHTSFISSASIQHNPARLVSWPKNTSELRIPVLCRGDSVGTRSVHFLFAFASKRSPSSYLTTTKTFTIKTKPSLDIRSSVRTVDSPAFPYSISMEIDNSHLNEEVHIEGITSIGPVWRLEVGRPLAKAPLPRHQTASFGWRLEQVPTESEICQPKWTRDQLEKLLQGEDISEDHPSQDTLQQTCLSHSSSMPDFSLDALHGAWRASRSSLRRAALRSQFPSIAKSLHPHLFRLFSQRSLDLVIFWSIPEKQIRGHHLVADLQIGPSTDSVGALLEKASGIAGGIYAESQRERAQLLSNFRQSEYAQAEMPLVISVELPTQVDMTPERRSCRAQAKITLKNISFLSPCAWSLTLQEPQADALVGRWYGRMSFSGSLAPGETTSCTASLVFNQPGLCQTGDWYLEVHEMGDAHQWSLQGESRIVAVQPYSGH